MKGALVNHGKSWGIDQDVQLISLFTAGHDLNTICYRMGRSASSICSRLAHHRRLCYDTTDHSGFRTPEGKIYATGSDLTSVTEDLYKMDPYQPDQQFTIKENQMTIANTDAVKVVTLIYGQPSNEVSDDVIFEHIAKLEAQIEQLNKVKTKPKKLQSKISALQDDINKLVEVVDNR